MSAPRDTPIIFSAPMIRALLDGRKTMTRRLAWKVDPVWSDGGAIYDAAGGQEDYVEPHWVTKGKPSLWRRVKPGDRLWARETWKPHSIYAAVKPRDIPKSRIFYAADNGSFPSNTPWRSPIHMPRWASRLTLMVTATKVEKLQEISHDDVLREGASGDGGPGLMGAFMTLWEKLHGADAWDANPEVVAIAFTVERAQQ